LAPKLLPEQREERRHDEEDERDDVEGVGAVRDDAVERLVRRRTHAQLDLERRDGAHEQGQQRGEERDEIDTPARLQDAQPDTQERAQQHEVSEEAEGAYVGGNPADQGEFDEQDGEGAQEQGPALARATRQAITSGRCMTVDGPITDGARPHDTTVMPDGSQYNFYSLSPPGSAPQAAWTRRVCEKSV